MVELLAMRITSVLAIAMKTGRQTGEIEQEGRAVCLHEKPGSRTAH